MVAVLLASETYTLFYLPCENHVVNPAHVPGQVTTGSPGHLCLLRHIPWNEFAAEREYCPSPWPSSYHDPPLPLFPSLQRSDEYIFAPHGTVFEMGLSISALGAAPSVSAFTYRTPGLHSM